MYIQREPFSTAEQFRIRFVLRFLTFVNAWRFTEIGSCVQVGGGGGDAAVEFLDVREAALVSVAEALARRALPWQAQLCPRALQDLEIARVRVSVCGESFQRRRKGLGLERLLVQRFSAKTRLVFQVAKMFSLPLGCGMHSHMVGTWVNVLQGTPSLLVSHNGGNAGLPRVEMTLEPVLLRFTYI